jgi:hypothetical protein
MADWRSLAQKLALADEHIESQEARIITQEVCGDGRIDKTGVNFMLALRRGAKSVAAEFDETVFMIVKQIVLKDGSISPERTRWLKSVFAAQGSLTRRERQFLGELRQAGVQHSREFVEWCDSLAGAGVAVASGPGSAIPVARAVPMVRLVEDDPIPTIAPIQPTPKPERSSSRSPVRRPTARRAPAPAAPAAPVTAGGKMGLLSLVVAFLVYVGLFALMLTLTVENTPQPAAKSSGMAQGLGIMASVPIALVGLILGAIGVFQSGRANRLSALAGVLCNGVIVLGCGGCIGVILVFTGIGAGAAKTNEANPIVAPSVVPQDATDQPVPAEGVTGPEPQD